jgi:hypothetical protein
MFLYLMASYSWQHVNHIIHIAQAPERQMVSSNDKKSLHFNLSITRNPDVIITGRRTMVAPIEII